MNTLNKIIIQLMILADNTQNVKELHLIDNLEELAERIATSRGIPNELEERIRYRLANVQCFAERYLPIYEEIRSYYS